MQQNVSTKKEWTIDTQNNVDESQNSCDEWKLKEYMLYDST